MLNKILLVTAFISACLGAVPRASTKSMKLITSNALNGTLKSSKNDKYVEIYECISGKTSCDTECTTCIKEECDSNADCTSYLQQCAKDCGSNLICLTNCEWISAADAYDEECGFFEDETYLEAMKKAYADFPDYMNMYTDMCSCMKKATRYADSQPCERNAYSKYVCLKSPGGGKSSTDQSKHISTKTNEDALTIPVTIDCEYGEKTISGQTYGDDDNFYGISIDEAKVNVVSCTFKKMSKGAIRCNDDAGSSSLGISKCTFTDCAPEYGVVVRSSARTVITYCNFKSCSSTSYGSIVDINAYYESSISNTNFTDCTVGGGSSNVVTITAFAKVTVASCYFKNIVTTSSSTPASLYVYIQKYSSPYASKYQSASYQMNTDDSSAVGSLVLQNVAFENVKINGAAATTVRGADADIYVDSSITVTPSIAITDVSSTQPAGYSLSSGTTYYEDKVTSDENPYKKSGADKDAGISLPEVKSQEPDDDDKKFPVWAIVLIVVVAVLIIAAVVIVIIYFVKCRKSSQVSASKESAGSEPEEA